MRLSGYPTEGKKDRRQPFSKSGAKIVRNGLSGDEKSGTKTDRERWMRPIQAERVCGHLGTSARVPSAFVTSCCNIGVKKQMVLGPGPHQLLPRYDLYHSFQIKPLAPKDSKIPSCRYRLRRRDTVSRVLEHMNKTPNLATACTCHLYRHPGTILRSRQT